MDLLQSAAAIVALISFARDSKSYNRDRKLDRYLKSRSDLDANYTYPITFFTSREQYERIATKLSTLGEVGLLWTLYRSPMLITKRSEDGYLTWYDSEFVKIASRLPHKSNRIVIFKDDNETKAYRDVNIDYHLDNSKELKEKLLAMDGTDNEKRAKLLASLSKGKESFINVLNSETNCDLLFTRADLILAKYCKDITYSHLREELDVLNFEYGCVYSYSKNNNGELDIDSSLVFESGFNSKNNTIDEPDRHFTVSSIKDLIRISRFNSQAFQHLHKSISINSNFARHHLDPNKKFLHDNIVFKSDELSKLANIDCEELCLKEQ